MILSIGLDVGNAALKVSGPGARRTLIPHTLAKATSAEPRDATLLPSKVDHFDYLHAEVTSSTLQHSTEVFAGTLAAREYPHLVEEAREGEAKAGSDRHLILSLVSLGATLHAANPTLNRYRVNLAVALPLVEVKSQRNRDQFSDRLRGEHLLRWISTPGLAGKEVHIDIDQVDVVPEGAAAYFSLVRQQEHLVHDYVLMVDIGARSLDWAAWGPGGKFQLGLSGGSADGGLAVAADRILAAARQVHGPHVARHRLDVLTALDEAAQYHKPVRLYGHGRPYDVSELATAELGRLARDVTRLIEGVVNRMGRVDHIVLVGGGGTLLAPYLQVVTDLPFTLMKDAQWANADGLYHRAIGRFQQQAGRVS